MKKAKEFRPYLVAICFVLGLVAGIIFEKEITLFEVVGQIFVKLIKFAVVPTVFVAISKSIFDLKKSKNTVKMVCLVLGIFVVLTMIASVIGVCYSSLFAPGANVINTEQTVLEEVDKPTIKEFVLNLLPTNPIDALVGGNTFHVIVVAVIFGVLVLVTNKEKNMTLTKIIGELDTINKKYIDAIVITAPVAVFCLTYNSFSQFGKDILSGFSKYLLCIGLSVATIYLIYLILLAVFAKGKTPRIVKGLLKIVAVAGSTSSSAATLPVSMRTCNEEMELDSEISEFVLPFGTTMNMNGAAQYMAVTFMFLSQIGNRSFSFVEIILSIALITILVMATPGIPGGAMVPSVILLEAFGIPADMFALVLGVYGFVDLIDTTVNVSGDVVTCVIAEKIMHINTNRSAKRLPEIDK